MSTTTTLQSFVEQFLDERHRLGFASRTMGHALRSFATYVDAQALTRPLRIEVMASWARCPKNASDDPLTWARRLKMLRPFARWFRQFEPDTAVPDSSIFGSVGQRLAPHIYTEQEIADLLAAAHRLQPPLRGATYETLFGLLAATGLRLSEAVHLLDRDVDLKSGLPAGAPDQVRQVSTGARPSDDLGGIAPLRDAARSRGRDHARRHRSSSVPAVGATGACRRCAKWIGSFSSCVSNSVGSTAAPMPHTVFMTCDTPLSCAGSCAGRKKASTSTSRCWPFRPTSVMPM